MTSRLNRPARRSPLAGLPPPAAGPSPVDRASPAHSSSPVDRSPLTHRWAFTATGCRWTVSTRRPLPEGLRRLIGERIDAFEGVWSRFRPDSLISRAAAGALPSDDDGAVVLRYARAQALLAREMAAELASASGAAPAAGAGGVDAVELTVAVNVDSLDTWFTGVLRRAADWPCRLRLYAVDETRTEELLRSGRVMAAISAAPTRVAGCRVERLGAMTYAPVVAASLLDGPGAGSVAELPMLRFDADDDLQDLALRAAGLPVPPPRAHVPTTSGFLAAIEAGLGWGVFPRDRLAGHPDLVPVPGLATVERELFWHRWSIASTSLDRLTDAVRESFGSGRQPSRSSRTSRTSRDSA